ncbi:MAG: clostripain-related cysteine peptidase [Pyrinomonadaceae bacterium]
MKTQFSVLTVCIAVLVIAGTCCSARAQASEADWTWMIYMDSDNNLESAQMEDIEEMMAVGSTANVNIVMLVDRSDKTSEEDGFTRRAVGGIKGWSTAKLLYVEKGKLRELGDWGEVNMGDPATLTKFLKTVARDFPAKHKALSFSDHGAGWLGIVSDESAGGDSLDTVELQSALKETAPLTGKFDLIGFDACMMANFEAAKAIAPFGKIMVASEELEPGNGWDYTPIIGALTKNPEMDGTTLGRTIIDSFKSYYVGPKQGNRDKTVTLSEMDLDKMAALETAVSNLGTRNDAFMKTGRETWLKTARARSKTEEFGVHKGDHFNYYDIVDYAENLKLAQPDAETIKSADAVIAATRAAVLYKINGAAHPNSNGLTIYFPPDQNNSNGDYRATPFSQSGKWLPFLVDYISGDASDTTAPGIQQPAESSPEEAPGQTITITAKVDADDIDEATFVLAESHGDQQVIIGAIPTEPDEKGILKEQWDGNWFSLGDGEKKVICPITNFEEVEEAKDVYLAEVPAQVRYKGGKRWHDVTLYFYLTFSGEEVTGEFVYAFEYVGRNPREIDIDTGDSIRPVYVSVGKNGEAGLIASEDEADILNIKEDNDLMVGRMRVAAGKYRIGFSVTDLAGNTSEKFTDVTVDK